MSQALRYHPCLEQRAIADTFAESLQALLPFERLHEAQCEPPALWERLDAIGLFAIGLDEDAGGAGLGAAEEALIAMELGRRLVSPSVIATLGAGHAQAVPGAAAAIAGLRVGAAYRGAHGCVLVADPDADAILLRDGGTASVHPVPAGARLLDDALWLAPLQGVDAPGEAIASFDRTAVVRLRLNDAAVLAGIAATALELAVAYALERRQFGRQIGSFQAVKHHCANMAIAARNARDQVGFASVAVEQQRPDAAFQVDCALLVAANAALRNAALNIQVHGGIGFSEEALPHVLLKRARLLVAITGGCEAALERIASREAA